MGSLADTDQKCWVTLITKISYLPGVIILAHTLEKHGSRYPLVVQYTSSLGKEGIAALQAEAQSKRRIIPDYVDLLLPREGHENTGSVAERFKDTYTKLRAFEVYKLGFTKACFLDADMAIFQYPDAIFDIEMPSRHWLAANHCCVCNLDKDLWAPSDWSKGNCAYTTLDDPSKVFCMSPEDRRPTYQILNGGMFLFYPTEELWTRMLKHFNTSDKLRDYQFPDQDFLADFYRDKWHPVSWKYNALKTMKYWHPTMWSDDDVVVLHYIVDKPWERQVSENGIGGHLGRDGETHQWWWDLHQEWLESEDKNGNIVRDTMSKLVGQKEPFTHMVPLPQAPGTLEDVQLYLPTSAACRL